MPAVMMLSRELRRVPLDYEHPKKQRYDLRTLTYVEDFQPVFDRFYVPEVREWLANWELWQKGEHPDQKRDDPPEYSFEDWDGNGPDPDYHYPGDAWPKDAEMGICMYESVTEGTPISDVYPDTPAGRRAMAEQIAHEDTSITSSLTVDDWLEVINSQTIVGTEIGTGDPVRVASRDSQGTKEPTDG